MERSINLVLPVTLYVEDGYFILCSDNETEKLLNIPIIIQADTLEEAKRKYWITVKCHLDYIEKRSRQLDKWKPFQKGPWKHIGGRWITIFGLHWSFRYGKQNKGGWFIPFTKLNISFTNYWRLRYKKPSSEQNPERSVATIADQGTEAGKPCTE